MRSAVKPLSELPVFRVVGGNQEKRKHWMHWIKAELAEHTLQTAIFPNRDTVTLIELYQQAKNNDIVLLDTIDEFPVRTIRLLGDKETVDDGSVDMVFVVGSEQIFILELLQNLDNIVRKRPVWGCILIGGKSSRMGRPKHLIEDANGKTWLEHTIATLQPLVDGLVLSGVGVIPKILADVPRLPDIPGVAGPLTGILSAMRWQPTVSWLLVACDMPLLSPAAVQWLLNGRRAGQWGQVPRLTGNSHCEPLLAWYDMYAAQFFEEQALYGNLRLGRAARHEKVGNPVIPEYLQASWENVNTPEQLHVLQKDSEAG